MTTTFSQRHASALHAYLGSSYAEVNQSLRVEDEWGDVHPLVAPLDELFAENNCVSGITVYRGMHLVGPLLGDRGTLAGYLSTSRMPSAARRFASSRGVLLTVNIVEPIPVIDVIGTFDDNYRGIVAEQELLFPRDCRFEVISRGSLDEHGLKIPLAEINLFAPMG